MAEQQNPLNQQRASSLSQRRRILLVTMIAVVAGIVAALAFIMHRSNAAADGTETSIDNVRAFAKIYGYVRYFHPSDAASAIDWERFAVEGVRRVKTAPSREALRDSLDALFRPIAPTVQIYADDDGPPAPAAVLTPPDTTGLKLVAWQHLGVGLGNQRRYRSIRLNRLAEAPTRSSRTRFVQHIDAAPFRGSAIRLSASVRTGVSVDGHQAYLVLYTALPSGQPGFMENRPITDPEWDTYTITGTVGAEADSIGVGGGYFGFSGAWFDDFQLHVRAEGEAQWSPVPLDNAGFEADAAEALPDGWNFWRERSRVRIDTLGTVEGRGSLAIAYDDAPRMARPLFAAHPKAGEVVDRPLGRGLSAQIPLALYSRDGQTLRPDDAPPVDRLEAALEPIALDTLTGADEALRSADVVIAWNVLQHFYPYFDVVDVDWDAVLTRTLRRASTDQTPRDFLYTLRWMVAQLDDGHGRVHHPLTGEEAGLPFLVDEVEGHIVIVAVADEAGEDTCVARGDVVVSLDGVPSEQVLSEAKRYISGSPQWKTRRALREFGRGERGTQAHLTLERAGRQVSCNVDRDFRGFIREERAEVIEELRQGVYYVDLRRAELSAIEEAAQTLAEAKGIIFDVRGYPKGNHSVVRFLSTDTLRSTRWQVPKLIYPDHMNVVGYTKNRWVMPPRRPHFSGEMVFLTDANAISAAESLMGMVEHYELAEIVGSETAGTNGNYNSWVLPAGYRIIWTGMRVEKQDGSQHHLIGIQPTVPVERTLEGVRAGRDEVLEEALTVIERSRSSSE